MSDPIYRFIVEYDPDPSNALHDPEGAPLPGSRAYYEANPILRLVDPTADPVTGTRRETTWAEYLEYEGNPDRHVVLAVRMESCCPCCQEWRECGSLWGIDFMDDAPECGVAGGMFTRAADLPGYLAEVARDLQREGRQY